MGVGLMCLATFAVGVIVGVIIMGMVIQGKMMSSDTELHWYCLSFVGQDNEGNKSCFGSATTGYNSEVITIERIKENRVYAKMHSTSILLSCSYLGYTTKEIMGSEND